MRHGHNCWSGAFFGGGLHMVGTHTRLHLLELVHFKQIGSLQKEARTSELYVLVCHRGGSSMRPHSSELWEFLELCFVRLVPPDLFFFGLCGELIFYYSLDWSGGAVWLSESFNFGHMSLCSRISKSLRRLATKSELITPRLPEFVLIDASSCLVLHSKFVQTFEILVVLIWIVAAFWLWVDPFAQN